MCAITSAIKSKHTHKHTQTHTQTHTHTHTQMKPDYLQVSLALIWSSHIFSCSLSSREPPIINNCLLFKNIINHQASKEENIEFSEKEIN